MNTARFCFMYDGVFYNVFPEAFGETPIISEVVFGDKIKTFFDRAEAEAAQISAYSRRIEYEENGLMIPDIFELLSLLEIIEIDKTCEELMDGMSLEVV